MPMNEVIAGVVILVIAVDIAALYWFARRFGLFEPVRPETKILDPIWVAYNTHSGPYQLIGPVWAGVCRELSETHGIVPELGCALFFDNPLKTGKDNLRSLGGCVVTADQADALKKTSPQFRMALLPGGWAVVARFPFRGHTSIAVGARRVYPAMNRHFIERGVPEGPIMEIYDVKAGEIRYIRPLCIPNDELERLL
jgi:hypothetical protein